MINYTKGEWKHGHNDYVTGPTTPVTQPFCGGIDWPYRTINVGEETIAIVPAQAVTKIIGQHSNPLKGSAEANAQLIASAPDLYEALKEAKDRFGNYNIFWVSTVGKALAKAEGKDS